MSHFCVPLVPYQVLLVTHVFPTSPLCFSPIKAKNSTGHCLTLPQCPVSASAMHHSSKPSNPSAGDTAITQLYPRTGLSLLLGLPAIPSQGTAVPALGMDFVPLPPAGSPEPCWLRAHHSVCLSPAECSCTTMKYPMEDSFALICLQKKKKEAAERQSVARPESVPPACTCPTNSSRREQCNGLPPAGSCHRGQEGKQHDQCSYWGCDIQWRTADAARAQQTRRCVSAERGLCTPEFLMPKTMRGICV